MSSRAGGVSATPYDSLNIGLSVGDSKSRVRENRRRLLAAAGMVPDRLARAEQVHGASAAVVDRGGLYEKTDALVTTEKDYARLKGNAALAALAARTRTLPIEVKLDDRDLVRLVSLIEAALQKTPRRLVPPAR